MKKFRFRGKKYAWTWDMCPLHKALVASGAIGLGLLACAYLWFLTSGIIIMFEPQV